MTEDRRKMTLPGNTPPPPIVPRSAREALRPEEGTPPPRRSRAARNRLVVFVNFMFTVLMLIVVGSGIAFWFGKQEFEATGPSKRTTIFTVQRNAGTSAIATQLERNGLISDARIFSLGARAYDNDDKMKAGEYEIKAGASMHQIMDLLTTGQSIQHAVTIPEGLTVAQALRRIAEHEVLVGDMPSEIPAEGAMVADTQKFVRGTTREELVKRLVDAQQELVETIWNRRKSDLPVNDINEFVTLASIVEKETGQADERSRVAGVFINRLRKGMRLQSDPTIIYGLFGGEGKPPGRAIYRSDIDKPTPYNTYTIDGLPPTPIAIPGRAALEAVANPSVTEDLYFVADGTGGHAFAKTLDEHNANVRRWREIERKRKEEAEAAEAEQTEGSDSQPPEPEAQ